MDKDKVIALGKLARIEIIETEAENLAHEFEGILGYVADVKKVAVSSSDGRKGVGEINVLRDDNNFHESGLYTEAILNAAPAREGGYVKVKKIL